jgi:hypothetical protein
MENLLWLLILPVTIPFIAAAVLKKSINYQEAIVQAVIMSLLIASAWAVGSWNATSDTEVWNGYIISKSRVHDTYEDPYDCMCTTDKDGNRSCQTCYETRYTVDWTAQSTVGNFTFKRLDTSSRSVYNTPDPADYAACNKGDPASREHSYTNYVQAVPDSLFASNKALASQFAGKIPSQPRVYAHYNYDRVINQGVLTAAEQKVLEDDIDNALKSMGASHQANIIVILTGITDPNFKVAVENTWLGGEKNDVVVFLGVSGNQIVWVDVMTWALNSGNELLQVKLRNDLSAMKTMDADGVSKTIVSNVKAHYIRPKMKDYEYLEDAVQPSDTMIIVILLLSIFGSAGMTYFFHKNDVRPFSEMIRGTLLGNKLGGSSGRRRRY